MSSTTCSHQLEWIWLEEKELSTTLKTKVFQQTVFFHYGYYSYRLSTSCDFVCSKMFRYMHLLTILCEAFMRLFQKEENKLEKYYWVNWMNGKKKMVKASHLKTLATPSRLRSSPSFPSRASTPFSTSLGSTGPTAITAYWQRERKQGLFMCLCHWGESGIWHKITQSILKKLDGT